MQQLKSKQKENLNKLLTDRLKDALIYDLLSLLPAGIRKDDIKVLQKYQLKTKILDYASHLDYMVHKDLVKRVGSVYKLFDYECDLKERSNTTYNFKTHVIMLFLLEKLDGWIE